MRNITCLAAGAAAVAALSLAHAADPSSDPYGLWKSLQGGMYKIHSGSVADRAPPTGTDRMLTVLIDGKAAKEVFDSIGPDVQLVCSGVDGDRDRRRKGIYCTYSAQDAKKKEGPYRCWIGVNLISGGTETTVSC
ncbi:hypothetical protein E4O92_01810 [Massilia horti]|uniref:Uncharacterized protein n=1 Tax=Massilia horti TaxID=2562153 RepID=A0A4Y9T5P1_9BURK|nr:hypothetical protein E4O92_01810 [Massilia horti]